MSVLVQECTFHMTCAVIDYVITEKNAFVHSRTTVSTVPPSDKN